VVAQEKILSVTYAKSGDKIIKKMVRNDDHTFNLRVSHLKHDSTQERDLFDTPVREINKFFNDITIEKFYNIYDHIRISHKSGGEETTSERLCILFDVGGSFGILTHELKGDEWEIVGPLSPLYIIWRNYPLPSASFTLLADKLYASFVLADGTCAMGRVEVNGNFLPLTFTTRYVPGSYNEIESPAAKGK
jgi:hypothetical protein